MTGHFFRLIAISVFAVVTTPLVARAQLASNKETLKDHVSVFLSISLPESDAAVRAIGVKKDSLERFILQRLVKSGIEVSTEFTDQTLILDVNVDLVKVIASGDTDVYAFVSRFEAVQAARLATSRQGALVTTWKATQFGALTRNQSNLLRDSVLQNLDLFVRDWKEVNSGSPVE